jgi:hypothetical protein
MVLYLATSFMAKRIKRLPLGDYETMVWISHRVSYEAAT